MGLVLLAAGASGIETILGGLALAIALWLIGQIAFGGRRSECQRRVARAARAILDAPLSLVRIDGVGFGDFLTFRHLSSAAVEGRLPNLVTFGGPAQAVAQVAANLKAHLEDETGRCYDRLRPDARGRLDAFADALREVNRAADAMLNSPSYDPAGATRERLYEELATALVSVERTGDDLDRLLDPGGFERAAAARASSFAELLRQQNHAAAVLHKSAQMAIQALELPAGSVRSSLSDVPLLIERLRRAQDWVLNVDATAFREATDEARDAHRQFSYRHLGGALDAAHRLAKRADDSEAEAELIDHLGRLPEDLAALDAIRKRRDLASR